MPRIIAGSAGSIPLESPRGSQTRPTSDKAKQALFSILGPLLPADGFLDLYAGSGQIGLEAASRGSRDVVMVEQARASLTCIRRNIVKTKLEAEVSVLAGDVRRQVKRLGMQKKLFAVIFLDPPYKSALNDFAALAADLQQLLRPGGYLVLEHDSRQESQPFVINLQLSRRCQYGTAMLSFYQLDKEPGAQADS